MLGNDNNNNSSEKSQDCLEKLRKFLQDDGSAKCPMDEDFLMKFVTASKYNADSARDTVRKYYEMRKVYRDDFQIFYPSALRQTLFSGIYMVLKHRDPLGRKILLFRTEYWDVMNYSVNEMFLSGLLIAEEMIRNAETQDKGIIMVHDLKSLSLSHARQFSLREIKKIVAALQGSFPAKIKAIHVINQPYIHSILFAITQPFLSKKFFNRIHLHGKYVSRLYEYIPTDILPHCIGGQLDNKAAEDEEFMNHLFQREQYYRDALKTTDGAEEMATR